MSLFPEDAPPAARKCTACDGKGSTRWHPDSFHAPAEPCIDPFCGVRRCREVTCEKCKGSGHINCFLDYTRDPNCGGFAEHFFSDGEDDMCEWHWSHCMKCGERLFVPPEPDPPLCIDCDYEAVRKIATPALLVGTSRE